MSTWTRMLRIGAASLACAALLMIAFAILREPGFQWDFFVYYHAAKAHAQGLNPYDAKAVASVAGTPVFLPFVYPPPALYFFRAFLVFEYPVALQVYFWMKIGVLIALFGLWKRSLLRNIADGWFYPFALLAFNGAIYSDLRSGNPAVLEQALLWVAFYGFIERRYALFCCGVLVASTIKLQPIVFLGLLLFIDDKRRFRYLAVSGLVVTALAVAWRYFDPELAREYVQSLLHSNTTLVLHERGRINPSILAAISSALALARERWPDLAPAGAEWVVYAGVLAVVSIPSLWALLRPRDDDDDRARFMVGLTCTAFALMAPRFKDYTYMLLIAPAFWIIHRTTSKLWLRRLLLALFMVGTAVPPDRLPRLASHLWEYSPLGLAWMTWFLYLRESGRVGAIAPKSQPTA